MENQNQSVKPQNKNKHLIIALSIIGAALIVALIIATVAIVGNLNSQVNGKDAEKLYASIESAIAGENNYHYIIERGGSGIVTGIETDGTKELSAQITSREEIKADGDDFYYERALTVNGITTTYKVTIVNGSGYIYNGTTGERTLVENASSDDFVKTVDVLKSVLWNYKSLFENSKIEKDGSAYKVNMDYDYSLDDPALVNALRENAQSFFKDYAGQYGDLFTLFVLDLQSFENYDYSVKYDEKGRPLAIDYEYDMGKASLFVGELSVNAEFAYGTASVEAPEDKNTYYPAQGK